MKFKFIKIDAESNTTYNCHAAAPHPINFEWLDNNPGHLFNTETNVRERVMMLRNERNSSCEQNCWSAEDRNAISPRIYQQGVEKTHNEPITTPLMIDLTSTSDCNLTCSYCTKEYSSAWRRDIINNGEYNISNFTDSRYRLLPRDLLLTKISQKSLTNSIKYKKILDEIVRVSNNSTYIVITGGEPLLDSDLLSKIKLLSHVGTIEIYTGLGVPWSRFEKIIKELKNYSNVQFQISAESIEEHLEFNRYGIKWEEFIRKVDYIKKHKIEFKFSSTMVNLTVLSFAKFVNYFPEDKIELSFGYQPRFLAPYVLDPDSKDIIRLQIESTTGLLSNEAKKQILASIEYDSGESERESLRDFLIEFTARRPNLNLNIFPASFLKWLDIKHVV